MNAHTSSDSFAMKAMNKTNHGKGAAREMRRQGFVPGVIYAKGHDSQEIGVNAKDLDKALRQGHFFTRTHELAMGDKGGLKVLARDIQRDPLTEQPIHIDFMKYDASSRIHVDVTVKIVGQENSPGIKEGGVLQLVETTIEVVCRADSIPEDITVDISALEIGDAVHLSEVVMPAGAKAAVTDRDLTIVSVVSTRTSSTAEDEAADAAAAAAAAPAASEVPATNQKAPAEGAAAAPAADAKGGDKGKK
ncbi:MAG: 50S ribosomal protein L25/general stress protein Ctc [Proteobacteria bacterium]|nr:50S ribosomal protein L25/general stress protein Ctc [Pseudomonadota bacterium]